MWWYGEYRNIYLTNHPELTSDDLKSYNDIPNDILQVWNNTLKNSNDPNLSEVKKRVGSESGTTSGGSIGYSSGETSKIASIKDPVTDPGSYEPVATSATKVKEMGNVIVGIIQTVGVVASVAILSVMGIKYMFGSMYEKAQYKETMIPYLIGAVLLFASSTIVNVIYQLSQNIK